MALADHEHDSNITLEYLMSKMSIFKSHKNNSSYSKG